MQALQPTTVSPCAEVSGLTAAITAAAGGSSDNAVDVDTVLELLLGAWTAQRSAEQQQLERLASQLDVCSKGLASQDEFAALVKQVMTTLSTSPLGWVASSCKYLAWLCLTYAIMQMLSCNTSPVTSFNVYITSQSGPHGSPLERDHGKRPGLWGRFNCAVLL